MQEGKKFKCLVLVSYNMSNQADLLICNQQELQENILGWRSLELFLMLRGIIIVFPYRITSYLWLTCCSDLMGTIGSKAELHGNTVVMVTVRVKPM